RELRTHFVLHMQHKVCTCLGALSWGLFSEPRSALQNCHGFFIAPSLYYDEIRLIGDALEIETERRIFMKPRSNACSTIKMAGLAALLADGAINAQQCLAGQAKKWEEVPEAVRATVLANGGKAGSVDKESEKI